MHVDVCFTNVTETGFERLKVWFPALRVLGPPHEVD